jgi:hypothetical protein
MDPKQPLVITCDELPCPPFRGNNRKSAELARALAHRYDVHLVCYPESPTRREEVAAFWAGTGVELHCLNRKLAFRRVRAVLKGLSIPTVTRDFRAEALVIRTLLESDARTRVLVDLISGSPLVEHFQGGLIVSGHDCMSFFWSEMARWSDERRKWAHAAIRQRFSLNAERRYFPRAEQVHVVSRKDAEELNRVDSRIRPTVIPLGRRDSGGLSKPWHQRSTAGVIWGNLSFPPIAEGVRRLLASVPARSLSGWILIGGVPEESLSGFGVDPRQKGIQYRRWIDDLDSFLGNTRIVVLPDLGGTGQKTRCVDALAMGACLIATTEVTRDLDQVGGRNYLEVAAPEMIPEVVATLAESGAAATAEMGQRQFSRRFSHGAIAELWGSLIDRLGPLKVTR